MLDSISNGIKRSCWTSTYTWWKERLRSRKRRTPSRYEKTFWTRTFAFLRVLSPPVIPCIGAHLPRRPMSSVCASSSPLNVPAGGMAPKRGAISFRHLSRRVALLKRVIDLYDALIRYIKGMTLTCPQKYHARWL